MPSRSSWLSHSEVICVSAKDFYIRLRLKGCFVFSERIAIIQYHLVLWHLNLLDSSSKKEDTRGRWPELESS
ncbi:hypothetical protein Trydic_g6256 [Trypoxylus dichotomus]